MSDLLERLQRHARMEDLHDGKGDEVARLQAEIARLQARLDAARTRCLAFRNISIACATDTGAAIAAKEILRALDGEKQEDETMKKLVGLALLGTIALGSEVKP